MTKRGLFEMLKGFKFLDQKGLFHISVTNISFPFSLRYRIKHDFRVANFMAPVQRKSPKTFASGLKRFRRDLVWSLGVYKGFRNNFRALKRSIQNSDTNITFQFALRYRTIDESDVVFLMALGQKESPKTHAPGPKRL